jgi:hypothetical protein
MKRARHRGTEVSEKFLNKLSKTVYNKIFGKK